MNHCESCRLRIDPEGEGHCYMFKVEPTQCGARKPIVGTERISDEFTHLLRTTLKSLKSLNKKSNAI